MINVVVDGKTLYKKESSDLFVDHYIPNVGDTFEVNLDDQPQAFFKVLKKHFIFSQAPSYDGSWEQAVTLHCKRLRGAL